MGNKGLKYDNIFFPISDLFDLTGEKMEHSSQVVLYLQKKVFL